MIGLTRSESNLYEYLKRRALTNRPISTFGIARHFRCSNKIAENRLARLTEKLTAVLIATGSVEDCF